VTVTGKQRSRLKTLSRTWGEWEARPVERSSEYGLSGMHSAWCNNRYHVQIYNNATAWGLVIQRVIGRHGDLEPVTWDELQRIKNELIGGDWVAIQVSRARANL
jgi:hypothetical protein